MSPNQFLFNKQFPGVIWGTIISSNGEYLILDVRDPENQTITYFKLSFASFDLETLKMKNASWWSKMEAFDGDLFTSVYQDKNDPNQKKFYQWKQNVCSEIEESVIPKVDEWVTSPSIYEQGTEYHQTVANFLAVEIPCSCEYLEINKKIILSYYLRSSKQLDRHLLVLDDGKKALKVVQDDGMKGFAPGAFFTIENRLFFVKNRNEICVHTL